MVIGGYEGGPTIMLCSILLLAGKECLRAGAAPHTPLSGTHYAYLLAYASGGCTIEHSTFILHDYMVSL